MTIPDNIVFINCALVFYGLIIFAIGFAVGYVWRTESARRKRND